MGPGRPADWLRLTAEGQVVLQLRHPWAAWPFDPAQDHPEPPREMAVDRRWFWGTPPTAARPAPPTRPRLVSTPTPARPSPASRRPIRPAGGSGDRPAEVPACGPS
jgi:hypothetical protein